MTSHLAAVGLEPESQEQLAAWFETMIPSAKRVGKRGNTEVLRWEDESGARVTFEMFRGVIRNFLPSYAGRWSSHLRNIRRLSDDVSAAGVYDDAGEQTTGLTIELEERALLDREVARADAEIVALGTDMSIFADPASFSTSESSLLKRNEDPGDPPATYREKGWTWPPRMAPESFISTGIFQEGEVASADARLNGTIIEALTRNNSLTGQRFRVVHVRTAGFEADLCLADTASDLSPGMVVGGWAFMVGSLHSWEPDAKPSLWRRLTSRA